MQYFRDIARYMPGLVILNKYCFINVMIYNKLHILFILIIFTSY